jgi:hypothetical protein
MTGLVYTCALATTCFQSIIMQRLQMLRLVVGVQLVMVHKGSELAQRASAALAVLTSSQSSGVLPSSEAADGNGERQGGTESAGEGGEEREVIVTDAVAAAVTEALSEEAQQADRFETFWTYDSFFDGPRNI